MKEETPAKKVARKTIKSKMKEKLKPKKVKKIKEIGERCYSY